MKKWTVGRYALGRSSLWILSLSLATEGCFVFDAKEHLDPDGDSFPWPEDCDNQDAGVHPGAAEVCDGVDQDCNGDIDDGVEGVYYADVDGDGYGDINAPVAGCSADESQADNASDCDDEDALVYPGAPEYCNDTEDSDCDGAADPGGPTICLGNAADDKYLGYEGGDFAGYDVAIGDVDGNGYADVLIGAAGRSGVGGVYVDLVDSRGWTGGAVRDLPTFFSGSINLANMGADIAFDTDGSNTYLAIGATGTGASGPSYAGTVFVLVAPATSDFPDGSFALAAGSWTAETWLAEVTGDSYVGHLGYRSTFARIDGEPYLLVSKPGEFPGSISTTAPGEVYLFDVEALAPESGVAGVARSSGDSGLATCSMSGAGGNDMAGFALTAADFDGDGNDEMVIAAPTDDGGTTDGGAVYIVEYRNCGATGDLATDATSIVYGDASYTRSGWAVAAGDTGRGTPALFVTSLDGGSTGGGAVNRFDSLASGSVTMSDADATFEGVASGDYAGFDLALGTDGGTPALLVGCYAMAENGDAVGGGYLVLDPGGYSGTSSLADADLRLVGSIDGERVGEGVAMGDLDNDGRPELLFSAVNSDGENPNAGAAYLVAGTSY